MIDELQISSNLLDYAEMFDWVITRNKIPEHVVIFKELIFADQKVCMSLLQFKTMFVYFFK